MGRINYSRLTPFLF